MTTRRRPTPQLAFRPHVAPGLRVLDAGDGCVIFVRGRRRFHRLNATASLVFALCTGLNSVSKIVDLVGAAYGLRRRLVREVLEILGRFEDEGLVVSSRRWRRAEGRDVPGLDIIVVANRHRTPLVSRHLDGYRYALSYTRDYRLPVGYVAHRVRQCWAPLNDLGVLRAYRGHLDALRLATRDAILVFEDDAVANRPDWMAVTRRAETLLRDWEVVVLHARDALAVGRRWTEDGLILSTLAPATVSRGDASCQLRVALGASLAYLIRRTTARRLLRRPFDGYPFDLLLVNLFRTAILCDSPFDHDRTQGSLTETAR